MVSIVKWGPDYLPAAVGQDESQRLVLSLRQTADHWLEKAHELGRSLEFRRRQVETLREELNGERAKRLTLFLAGILIGLVVSLSVAGIQG